jgi:hypothetical protein
LQATIVQKPIKVINAFRTIEMLGKQISDSNQKRKSQQKRFNMPFGTLFGAFNGCCQPNFDQNF